MSIRFNQDDHNLDEMHEINVTPFIDVMLVLLIIFMVAAPLSTVDVAVDLPAAAVMPQPRPPKPLFLTVKADLTLAAGEETVPREAVGQVLSQAANGDKGTAIFCAPTDRSGGDEGDGRLRRRSGGARALEQTAAP
jgi:biopolymer transport protein ExbD